ncbi:uncharacterized protein [Euwallacea similis]|uniref:uncharacterized protein n=1 Tax=Euwallacea similis TaxID=1736056 RepID=UPI00344F388D
MDGEIISRESCKKVVKEYLDIEDFEICDVKIEQFFDEVNGFLGEHLLLLIDIRIRDENKVLRFFTKRFPFGHVMQSDFLISMNGWQREIYFYEIFLKNLHKTIPGFCIDFVPKYLLGIPNDIIVFEDLTLKNYDLPRQTSLNLLNNKHICLVLEALAKLHASSLAYEEYKSREHGEHFRLFSGDEDFIKEPLIRKEEGFLGHDFYNAAIKGLRALISKVYKNNLIPLEEVHQKFDILAEHALELMTPQNIFRNVLAHGDLWAKNVMFQYEGESDEPQHVLLVDFQLPRYHIPAHDVLLFISLTTNKEMRKRYFHFFLKHYHNALSEQLNYVGIKTDDIGLSYDEFLKSVSYIIPEVKIQGPLQRLQQCGNKNFYKNLLNDKEAFKMFIFGDKTPFALELFETDDNFRILLTEAIEEIIEVALHPQIFREDCYRILEQELGHSEYEIIEYRVSKISKCDFLFQLEVSLLNKNERQDLKYLAECKPLGYTRLVERLI